MIGRLLARRWFVLTVLFVGLLATTIFVLGVATDGQFLTAETKSEFAKSAIQLLVVTLVGALVTVVLSGLDRSREDARRDDRARLRIVRDATLAYNRIKAVRRSLVALGFERNPAGRIDAYRSEFLAEMQWLSEAQLQLEQAKREARVRSGAFRSWNSSIRRYRELVKHLEAMERYANDVVDEWEKVQIGDPRTSSSPATMPCLTALLGSPNAEGGLRFGWHRPGDLSTAPTGPSAHLRRLEELVSDPRYSIPEAVTEREDAMNPATRS